MITANMMSAAKQETQEQQAAQWTTARIAETRTDALTAANDLHARRWGVAVPALTAEIEKRNAR